MRQVTSGIFYMHKNCVCHRDLKLENFLVRDKASDLDSLNIKIIDFGLARGFTPGVPLQTKAGTPFYVAPQVLTGRGYDHSCDIWSVGVCTYVLLCGYPPFVGRSEQDTLKGLGGEVLVSQ